MVTRVRLFLLEKSLHLHSVESINRWHRSQLTVAACIAAAAIAALIVLHKHAPYREPASGHFPVRGIDISAHNGTVDFGSAAADDIRFVLIKATEGSSFKDPRFMTNYREARKSGLKVGVYHFFRFDVDGKIQALNFINTIGRLRIDMPVAIDIEEWANPGNIPTDLILERLDDLISHLIDSGFNVMLYSNKNGHQRFLKDRNTKLPLWICSIPEAPADMDWLLWQYTHQGRIDGVNGSVDINVYNGSTDEWDNWTSTSAYSGIHSQ